MPEGTAFAPLPVVMAALIAVSALVAIAITALLIHQIARRALDKSTPDDVESVIHALGTLIDPLRMFLPWARRSRSGRSKKSPTTEDRK
ncbi:hypothetical protein GCM10010172_16230 [Paractinoplanes ferrugineus]|uniref:Uncharacterized protein n=1 Tax=Paractinoplanes ferrugineus TaxID=113564 RepID=A0A919MJI2_9ACTN|nr:hypothetical protein [Actinoplanes ferrugineus]GIE10187.1 hypothetical protein Afe05nite_20270 [Actinoplanes ferrugineus]